MKLRKVPNGRFVPVRLQIVSQRPAGLCTIPLLVFLLFAPLLSAQDHSAKDFLPNVLSQQKRIWSFPLSRESWKKPELWLTVGLSAISFSLDGTPAEKLRNNTSFKDFNDVFASNAADLVVAALPAALAAGGELTGRQPLRSFGWKSSEAALDAFLVTTVWKTATQRSRPHKRDECGFWQGGNSFPSGHSAVAWAVAASAVDHFKTRRWVPLVAYPAAALVSFSRVSSGNHYPSDVVFGAALGYAIGSHVIE